MLNNMLQHFFWCSIFDCFRFVPVIRIKRDSATSSHSPDQLSADRLINLQPLFSKKSQRDDKLTKTWNLPVYLPKRCPYFSKMSPYEEFGHPGKGLLRPLCVKWVKLVRGPFRRAAQTLVREGSKKRKALLIGPGYYWPRPPHPLVGPWDFEIWRPNLNDAVDVTGPETDFTLETDGKMCIKN